MTKSQDDSVVSFLSDIQKEGKATGKITIENIDEALGEVNVILNKDVAEAYRNKPEEEWPTAKMSIYCQDCRDIVPAGIGETQRGNPRTVCGVCGSKKIATGRREVLESFYHIEENKKKRAEKELEKSKEEKI